MTGGDREKLAREMREALRHVSSPDGKAEVASGLAIAYADRRVAEAYEAAAVVAEDIQPGENGETVMQIAMCIRALNPAREGGEP